MGITDKLKNEIYECGVIETTHLAYEQTKRHYFSAVSAQDKKAVSYYRKQMDILHKAWMALEDNNN
jgi:hypothetical protein